MAVDFWGRREVGDERGHNCPTESKMMMMRVEQSNVGEDEARVAESGEWSEWLSEQQCGWVKAFLRTFWGLLNQDHLLLLLSDG